MFYLVRLGGSRWTLCESDTPPTFVRGVESRGPFTTYEDSVRSVPGERVTDTRTHYGFRLSGP